MALTYAQMLTKVRDYTEVDSTVLSDSIINDFILDAEANIYRDCDGDYCREQSTSTFVAGHLLTPPGRFWNSIFR